ncbi:hypothetical protein [Micromonospora sp. NPDC005087]|uniref:hypothetical protein n=1 Tax=Micromonospora sp. NPDC005087 TaxID=3364225 RepID=UPI0036D11710
MKQRQYPQISSDIRKAAGDIAWQVRPAVTAQAVSDHARSPDDELTHLIGSVRTLAEEPRRAVTQPHDSQIHLLVHRRPRHHDDEILQRHRCWWVDPVPRKCGLVYDLRSCRCRVRVGGAGRARWKAQAIVVIDDERRGKTLRQFRQSSRAQHNATFAKDVGDFVGRERPSLCDHVRCCGDIRG